MFKLSKRGQLSVVGSIVGAFAGLISFVVIIVVSGMINTVSADVVQDITDDMTAGSVAEAIGNTTLDNQQTIANRTGTFTTSGIGLLLIAIIFTVAGGFLGGKLL